MTIKTCLVVGVLALAPAFAMACPKHDQHAQSCADGFVMDDDKGVCVAKTTS